MKRLFMIAGMAVLLTACAGGGSGGGSDPSGSSKTVIGYAYTVIQSGDSSPTGILEATAVYSDGSVDGTGTSVATTDSGGGNLLLVTISGTNYIFKTNGGADTVSSYKVAAGNSITKIGSYSDDTGCGPFSLATNKTGTELFVGCTAGGIDTFMINSDGSLSTLQAPAYVAGSGDQINSMTVDQSGSYLIVNAAVNTYNSEFIQLSIGGGGALTLSSSQTGIVGWQWVTISDPNTTHGNYFYAGGSGDTNYYLISESGGTITVTEQTALETYSWPVWIDQTGSWLTSLNSKPLTPQTTYIQQYTIGSGGTLSTNGSSVTINSTWEDSASPAQYDSVHGFVIMRAENAIIVGAPNSLNGLMTIKGTGTGGYYGLAYVPVD